ncbi:hypothetical protein ES708_20214 [subsurface metagenome]
MDGSEIKIYGWDDINKKWISIIVDENGWLVPST